MPYTHRLIWEETLTGGALDGMEVTKDFGIVNPSSKLNQLRLAELRRRPTVRNARIIRNTSKGV